MAANPKSDPVATKILYFIQERNRDRSITVTPETDLFGSGALDSFGVIELISFAESEFGISVPNEDLTNVNFQNVVSFSRLINKLQGNATP